MLVILPHGLLAMTIVSKLHVRNVSFMTLTPLEKNAWRLVPTILEATHGNQKIKEILARESL
jgi:hypothetical protein